MEFKELIGKTLKMIAFEPDIIEFTDIDDNVYALRRNSLNAELKIKEDMNLNNILMSPIIAAYDLFEDDADYDECPTYTNHQFHISTEKGKFIFDFYEKYPKDLYKFGKVYKNNGI